MSQNPHPQYPHLLSPLQVGSVTLPNRVLMGSMHIGLEEERGRLEKMAAFFEARARGGVGLIVTGGVSPNWQGMAKPFAAKLSNRYEVWKHRVVTDAVHAAGGKICMQILHTGRYAYTPLAVSASALKSPISPFKPKALSTKGVHGTIQDYVTCAQRAHDAGYDGVEVMGSEGYLINQFIVSKTNKRSDKFGGSYENRMRFPVEIVRQMRQAVGPDFIIIYRLSMLDLVESGSTWEEVVTLAKAIEDAGASIINTGIGWHEARVPTIATMVPRKAFTWVTHRLKGEVSIPLVTSNRINMPQVAEDVLANGDADMISMARPFLADPDWVIKAESKREDEINTCIACNQACLDLIFQNKRASCMVNPLACYETEVEVKPTTAPKKIGIIGAGPAGLAYATTAAQRGHKVTLFDAADKIGGQFNMAKKIPGKEEFQETLRYYGKQIELHGVDLKLSSKVAPDMVKGQFDHLVLATGVHPRKLKLPGIDHPKVLSYVDVINGKANVGKRVAIIGAGGIGFDVADFLSHGDSDDESIDSFLDTWGVDKEIEHRGGLVQLNGAKESTDPHSRREIFLCQRKSGKLGAGLGKTTGWIHRTTLKNRSVEMLSDCEYTKIDDQGLHLSVKGDGRILDVDHVVICAGQVSANEMAEPLRSLGQGVDVIGGAYEAGELDARRAIDQATRLAVEI
jgi:2,4-dienoyl-CoA reductase (NADPH2)